MCVKKLYILSCFVLAGIIISCSAPKTQSDELKSLLSLMTGSFSSAEQAQADTNFFDISLEMVQIWNENKDGYWLYVEQASAENLEKPYRQRIYHLTQSDDSTFKSDVYTLKNPLRFAGEWQKNNPLSTLTPDSLSLRKGCSIFLNKRGKNFYVGSTSGVGCDSELRGADYAMSVVIIREDELFSWDQGFDISGKQVWGSQTGGYIFKREK